MRPSGPPTPIGGAQSSVLRSNSAIVGSQGGSMPPQATFSSAASPRDQYNVNLLGSTTNIFETSGTNSCPSVLRGFQRGNVDAMAELDSLSTLATDVGLIASSSSFAASTMENFGSAGQIQNQQMSNSFGNTMLLDQQQSQVQKFEQQNIRHAQLSMQQFPVSHGQPQQQQHQAQSIRGGIGGMGSVKLEPQTMNDHIGQQQQFQSLRNPGPSGLELQQNQIGRGIGPVKPEHQHSDQAMLLQQQQQEQQQQQQFLHLSRQPSQAAIAQMNLLQQQRILQLQQQQRQLLLKALPQQRPQLQQQFQQQTLPIKSAVAPVYEIGMCSRRLTQYMYQQQRRPADNNIEFWRKFVVDFFAPNARKRLCVSLYGNSRQTHGVFPQDIWHCEICDHKPGRGFETTVDILPRLFKIKYDSGTLEELLYVDMPREYLNATGQIVLDYAKAIQESVFENLRVVRDGQLRIVFSPDLKICSWEFCARRHEELIPRRFIIPPVSQLGAAAQKYQASAQNESSNLSPDLRSNCDMFVASARQLAKALEVPLVNDLGYSKRYIRCLQISEVVNSMKDLIDYYQDTGKGPMESLAQFARRSSKDPSSGSHLASQPQEQQQAMGQSLNNDQYSVQGSVVQPSISNGTSSVNGSHGMTSTSSSTILQQNSLNFRIENQNNNPTSPYAGSVVQIPSAGSSTAPPPVQTNPSSPFSSPSPSSSNNHPQGCQIAVASSATTNNITSANSSAQIPPQLSTQSNEVDPTESQSSYEKLIQEVMTSSQLNAPCTTVGVCSLENNVKSINGLTQLSQNSINSGIGNGGFGNFGGIRGSIGSNSGGFTGRVGMSQNGSMNHQQQELANQLRNGLGAVNGYNNLQF